MKQKTKQTQKVIGRLGRPKSDAWRDADVEFQKIKRSNGILNAQLVVEAAKDRDNPLHRYFDWDNSSAGHKYRLMQARILINQVMITIHGEEFPKYENMVLRVVSSEDGDKAIRGYKEYVEIINDNDYKEQMVLRALQEIKTWQRTYERYREFQGIRQAISKTEMKLLKKGKKVKGGNVRW